MPAPIIDKNNMSSHLLPASALSNPIYAPGLALLKNYSYISESDIPTHVQDIQTRAYALTPYPCIGQLRFLILSLAQHAHYPSILARLHRGATYLDLGCCFGQDIRRLALDGAPVSNCIGVDIQPQFFPLAYELFGDEGRLGARFCAADVFDEGEGLWAEMSAKVDVVHMANFLHLFGWEKQVSVARRVARILRKRKGSVVLGLQLGVKGKAGEVAVVSAEDLSWGHSRESMQALWDGVVGELNERVEEGEEGGLRFVVDCVEREMPQENRTGPLANPRLQELFWVAKLV